MKFNNFSQLAYARLWSCPWGNELPKILLQNIKDINQSLTLWNNRTQMQNG